MSTCEFFYDFSSPYAYLGATQIDAVCAGHELVWRPMLLGGLFHSIGTPIVPLATFPPAKAQLAIKDQFRWADHLGVKFTFPSVFPQKTVTVLRIVLQAPPEKIGPLSIDFFEEMWVRDGDLNDRAALEAVISRHGLDPEAMLAGTADPAIKDRLRKNTEEAAARGVVGAPTCIVDDRVFWGQDRFVFVKKALDGWVAAGEDAGNGLDVSGG